MGLRGPKPTPTALLKLRGSWRADGRPDASECGMEAMPPAPAWMSAAAVEQWQTIGAWLVGCGIMLDRYSPSVAEVCDAYAHYIGVRTAAEGQPYWIGDEQSPRPHPVWEQLDKAAKRLKDSLARHGLSPSSAAAIQRPEKKREDGLAGLKLSRA